MHFDIELNPQVADRLTEAARNKGVDPATLLENLVTEHLPSVASSTMPSILFPPTGRAAPRLRVRLTAEASDDPEVIRKAQEALDEMKVSMNSEHKRSRAERVF